MSAPKGNEFWKARSTHGRFPIFASPEDLWSACQEYFQWVEDNPLHRSELVTFQGIGKLHPVPIMRAMTIEGLCIFLDIGRSTWDDYCGREDFSAVTTRVKEIMRDQKFSGAAAGLLNANIIARDLGLRDTQDLNHGGQANNPVKTVTRIELVGVRAQDDDATDQDS